MILSPKFNTRTETSQSNPPEDFYINQLGIESVTPKIGANTPQIHIQNIRQLDIKQLVEEFAMISKQKTRQEQHNRVRQLFDPVHVSISIPATSPVAVNTFDIKETDTGRI